MLGRTIVFGENALKTARTLVASLVLAAAAFAQTPATQPTTGPAEEAAVLSALAKYNEAIIAGDVATLTASIATTTEQQKQALSVMGRLTTASSTLFDAAQTKFGAEELMKEGVTREAFPGGFPPLPTDQLKVRVEGDRGILSVGESGQPVPLSMVKADGAWKINGGELLPPFTDKQLADQTAIIEAAVGAMTQTTEDVNAGKFRSADEVPVLMQHRVQKAIQAAQMKLLPQDGLQADPAGPATAPATQPMP
jgi:hypothetical protein